MNYLKKILTLLIKQGKKTIAVNTVDQAVSKLRKRLPMYRITRMFERLVPGVKVYKKKVAGKVYQIPAVIKQERAVFQTAKWITQAMTQEKKGKKLSFKLIKVLLETVKRKGAVLKLRKQYLAVIKENRSYMRFIRRKRIKRKSWLFQQRYTTRTIINNKKIRMRNKKDSQLKVRKNGNKNKKTNTANKKHRRKI